MTEHRRIHNGEDTLDTCTACAWASWDTSPSFAEHVPKDDREGWASYAAEQERHAETARARDEHYEARNLLAAKVDRLEERLVDMTRDARLSRDATENAVQRLEKLRSGVAYLHDVYAVAPGEPRCCSDCAANDISDELRRVLRDA